MTTENIEYTPIHFADNVEVINPKGGFGVLVMRSKIDYIIKLLGDLDVDLSPSSSKIAFIANLSKGGIPALLRNLLYNPQVRDLIICGSDPDNVKEDLISFFDGGIEYSESLGQPVARIKGTGRVIDCLVTPDLFEITPKIREAGNLRTDISREMFLQCLDCRRRRNKKTIDRLTVPLPAVSMTHCPSEVRNCNIVAESPLEAWKELVFRLVRFGHPVTLKKGDRQELQNVKVVVTDTKKDTEDDFDECGFCVDSVRIYCEEMFEKELPEDEPYSYGNRLGRYFGFDALTKVIKRLRESKQDRYCFVSLWDTQCDLDADVSPCLTSLFFRVYDDKLTATALYRTHNALDAWINNVYALLTLRDYVAEKTGIEPGPVTVMSCSISVDPAKYNIAKRVAASKAYVKKVDPNGRIEVEKEGDTIVAKHIAPDGTLLGEYRAADIDAIRREVVRNCAISDIDAAISLGVRLAELR